MAERLPDGGRIEQTTIDGVRVFWTPDATRTIGSLQFRTGRGDEPFAKMGVTHLVEHLALFPIGRKPYEPNGFVDHVRTVFHARGSVDEVSGFLGELTHNLAHLPLERLPNESRILRTEARGRTPTIPGHLLWLRYGPNGFGGLIVDENGLGSIDGMSVQSWSDDRFTADNAVAWFSFEPPADLQFGLPHGTPIPPVERREIDDLVLPAWAGAQMPGIALGIINPRNSASTMAMRVLTHRLEQRLRYEMGKSYEVSLAYLPLDAEVAHASFFASCLETEAGVVRQAFLEVLDAFLASGPTIEELDEDIDGFRRSWDDPDSVLGELERLSFNTLLGHPLDSPVELIEEMKAVTTESARDAFVDVMRTAILAGPVATPPDDGKWHAYPNWSTTTVTGRRFDTLDRKYPWSKRVAQLIVGPEGVSWQNAEGRSLTVRFDECVGVLAGSNGVRSSRSYASIR